MNQYKKKTATKESICFICNKPTVNVLANDADFFFACVGHLKDSSFCTPHYPPDPPKPVEIEKIEEKEPDKEEKDKSKDETDPDDKKNDKKKEKKEEDKKKAKVEKQPEPVVEKIPDYYTLHRNIFYLREKQMQKKNPKPAPVKKAPSRELDVASMFPSPPKS